MGGEFRFASKDAFRLGLTGSGLLAGSAYPRPPSVSIDFDMPSHLNVLIDLALGLVLVLPSANGGGTRLSVTGMFRAAPARTLASGAAERSGGLGGSLQVPVGGLFAMVGAFSARYLNGIGWETTSSFTLAKAID